MSRIVDAEARRLALDGSRSFIVQAPAGSGKTELLIQRLLVLLNSAERPQQILAITFTNKAAAEMRQRLLEALVMARDEPKPEEAHKAVTWQLARAAFERHGEALLKNPAQLAIQTIDSFNVALVRKMPWLSRFGGVPQVREDASALYSKAVEQLMGQLDNQDQTGEALRTLLRHFDNRLGQVEQMLVGMLAKRDQWLRYLASEHGTSHQQLQENLEQFCALQLEALVRSFPPALADELLFCASYAARNCPDLEPLVALCLPLPSGYMALPLWQALAELLLTASGEVRKTVNKNNGFPAGNEGKAAKQRMLELLTGCGECRDFVTQLAAVRTMPGHFSSEQWQVLRAVLDLLPMLLVELWLVFRQQSKIDFSEIALKAGQALGRSDNPSDLLLRIDNDLQHILVDEFQDTSRLQYSLLNILTSGWLQGDGRTLFLVGDPMQSIYRFREAEVGLFLQSFGGDFGANGLKLTPLTLQCNFRSQQGIVDWVNRSFKEIFPPVTDIDSGAVSLSRAHAVHDPLDGMACSFYPYSVQDDKAEARQVVEIIRETRIRDPQGTIAILVRGRTHLREILPLLRANCLSYQAQDIDQLGARPAALDLVALVRALLHRGDRLAWLAVLRAPWCGLELNDLHVLLAGHPRRSVPALLQDDKLRQGLSPAGQQRLQAVAAVLLNALDQRGRFPLRDLIERCWFALGAASCYDSEGLADAELVFALIEDLQQGGELEDLDQLEREVGRLFARADASADARLQIMTIHKSKGLEFDTVIIPGLGKTTGRSESPLLRWLEHPHCGLLLAPRAASGADKDPLYQLIGRLEQQKGRLEDGRLLYVATTRAIKRLHLLGHATANKAGEFIPAKGSLLEQLWPLVKMQFAPSEDPVAETLQTVQAHLKRLPLDWHPPVMSGVELPEQVVNTTASVHGDLDSGQLFSGWETPLYRHVGTLVHWQLEQLARRGCEAWTEQCPKLRQQRLKKILSGYGTPGSELSKGVEKATQAVERIVQSERGRWILAAHTDHQCELPISGVVDGQLVHAIIDRTFIADGICWIIDYKNSTPASNETLETFVQREAGRYRSQLYAYTRLRETQLPQIQVRAALYFPLADAWYEYADF